MAPFWQRFLQFPVAVVMAAYYMLTAVVEPLVKPIAQWLAELRILVSARRAIEALPPYPSLLFLAVPVIIIEPLKIGSLAIMGTGHFILGALALAASQTLSLIIIERLFEIVKPRLLTIRWFAIIWGWFTGIRDRMIAWVQSTWAWSIVVRVRDAARSIVTQLFRLVRR